MSKPSRICSCGRVVAFGEICECQRTLILDDHAGDALAALRTVIADAEFLCDQLETASMLISPGLVRGWKPKFQREN